VKCVAWSPQGLDHSISLPLGFFTLNSGFHILGAPMGSRSFVESFVAEAFREDMGICNLFMLVDLEATFVMFLLCYAQRLSYNIL
jgi:hypothetical protein